MFLISDMRAACSSHLKLLDPMTRILWEDHKVRSSSLCETLTPVASSRSDQVEIQRDGQVCSKTETLVRSTESLPL
jgi:hypothetical protein